MSDYTDVYFTALGDHPFHVASTLASFDLFGHPVEIKWYGAIIAFGFLLAVLFGGRIAWKWKISLDKMVDVLIYGTLAGIVGARLYYVFSRWDYYGKNLAEIPQIWNGGLAIYGGLILGLLAAFVVCRVRKLSIPNLLDMATMSFLIGQGIGRWGNFTNQEAFGINTDAPWGMWSEKVREYIVTHQSFFAENGITMDPNKPVHPTFLYESISCLVGFAVLYIILRKARKFSGQMALCYGVWYGTERAIVEGLRTDSLYIAGTTLRISQVISIVLALVCAVVLVTLWIKYTKHPKPIDGVDYFSEQEEKARAQALADTEDWVAHRTQAIVEHS
ncbi:MAG: prolipoprotein diacylglyceryl transferase [Clostridia bacterium]|nr:prolipoprotein diacylglyceryl transferase [Clostridia bacterium]